MHFLIDAQLPPALARWLTSVGHPADHVADHGMSCATDDAIWTLALERGMVIVSKDDDFAVRRVLTTSGPQVLWVRCGNASRSETIARFQRALPSAISALTNREPLVEMR